MRVLLNDIQREWGERIYHMVFWGIVFLLVGFIVPKIYYRYVDTRQYITVQSLAFNKKVFTPCEEVVYFYKYHADFDAEVSLHSRLIKFETDHKELVSTGQPTTTFVNKTPPEGDQFTYRTKLPCNFKPGVYQLEGIITYHLKGEKKTSAFRSAVTTVQASPSGEVVE